MRRDRTLLYGLVIIKFIAPFLLQNSFYQPHRDEFLYLAEGQHLAWGYMEVPPLLSVFAWFTNLAGDSMFLIKFWPALFGALTYLVTGKTILSLGGKSFALFLGFLPFVIGAYLRVHYLFQPNFLEIFFWTMIAYTLIRYVQTQQNRWLYFFGVCAGLGMMSKYSVALFIISVLVGFLLTSERKIFLNKHFYFAALLAFFIFLPNLIWQFNHRFPVIHHMEELQQTQLQFVSPVSFLIDQLLMNLPAVFIWLAGLYFVSFTSRGMEYRLFGWAYFSIVVLLLILHGKSYYALGIYPVLFAFGAVQLEQFAAQKNKTWRYVFVIIPLLLGIPFIPVLLPTAKPLNLARYYEVIGLEKTGLLKWEDLKNHQLPQDFADMLGWKEIAEKTAAVYKNLPPDEQLKTMVFCTNYGLAGALNFYRKDFNLPEVYSDNGSFITWLPHKYTFLKNLLFIGDDAADTSDIILRQFESFTIEDSLNYPMARENGAKIVLYQNANDKLNAMISKHFYELKKEFER